MPEQNPAEVRELLERIDLDKLTLGEIRRISNPVLRKVLAELISDGLGVKTEHASHTKHSDYLKSHIFDRPITDNPISDNPS